MRPVRSFSALSAGLLALVIGNGALAADHFVQTRVCDYRFRRGLAQGESQQGGTRHHGNRQQNQS